MRRPKYTGSTYKEHQKNKHKEKSKKDETPRRPQKKPKTRKELMSDSTWDLLEY